MGDIIIDNIITIIITIIIIIIIIIIIWTGRISFTNSNSPIKPVSGLFTKRNTAMSIRFWCHSWPKASSF